MIDKSIDRGENSNDETMKFLPQQIALRSMLFAKVQNFFR